MRIGQPEALDMRSVLESAFSVRDEEPDLWRDWMLSAFANNDDWHAQPSDKDDYVHHASGLGGCDRAYVFDRAQFKPEETAVESLAHFEIGSHFHLLVQFGLAVHPDYVLLGHEMGGKSEQWGLAARADAVYMYQGTTYLIDVKTESPYAPKMRRKDAEDHNQPHTARPEHVIQLSATAIVLQELFPDIQIDAGWVIYATRDAWDIDQQEVELRKDEAIHTLENRKRLWGAYDDHRSLPPVLAAFPQGLCRSRSAEDPRGLYCRHKLTCVAAQEAQREQ